MKLELCFYPCKMPETALPHIIFAGLKCQRNKENHPLIKFNLKRLFLLNNGMKVKICIWGQEAAFWGVRNGRGRMTRVWGEWQCLTSSG